MKDTVNVVIRFRSQLHRKAVRYAEEHGCSLNALINMLLALSIEGDWKIMLTNKQKDQVLEEDDDIPVQFRRKPKYN
jgi:hypothetical protein